MLGAKTFSNTSMTSTEINEAYRPKRTEGLSKSDSTALRIIADQVRETAYMVDSLCANNDKKKAALVALERALIYAEGSILDTAGVDRG